MLIQGGGGIGDILSGILSAGAQYVHGAEQAKQANAARQRQDAIDAQNRQLTALSIANQKGQLTSQGLDTAGNRLPDPYTASRQAQPAVPDEMGGLPARPAATTPDDLAAHIAALNAVGQTGVATQLQKQQDTNRATITGNVDLLSKGYNPDGTRADDPYTAPAPKMGPDPALMSPSKNAQGQPIGPAAPGPMVQQPLTLRDQANQLHAHAIALTLAGQTVPGSSIGQQADALDRAATAADESTVRFLNAATEKQKADAQIHHWSTSDSERAKNDTQRLAVEIRNGNLTYEAALAHVGATYAGINQNHFDRQSALDQSQQNWIASHVNGAPKGAISSTSRQAQNLTGEVTSLRGALRDFKYDNKIDQTTPQGQEKIKKFVQTGGYSPDAIRQVVPFAAGGAAPASPVNAPPAPTAKFVPGRLYQDAKGNKARYNADGSWTPQ